MLRASRPQGAAPAAPQQPQGAPAPQMQAPAQNAAPQYQAPANAAPAAPQYQAAAPAPAPASVAAAQPQQEAAPQYQAPQYQNGQPQYGAQPQQYAAPQYQEQAQSQPQYGAQPQYQPQGQAPVALGDGSGSVAQMNAGILENMDGVGNIGNYVTVDGSDFLYKSSDRKAQHLDVNVHYGKRFYQWVDESNPSAKQYHNSDTKLDERYKLKMEIRWYEPSEEGQDYVEYIMSLGTTSAIQFLDYVKTLAKAGLGVGQVWTRMTISRHNRPNSTDRYSRVDFEAFRLEDGQPLGIKSNA